MVLGSDLGEVLGFGAIDLHVLSACVAEQHRGEGLGHGVHRAQLDRALHELLQGVGAVGELEAQGAALHLLEADCEDTVVDAAGDEVFCEMEGGGACGAVVVDVVDGHSGHSHLVDCSLWGLAYLCPQVESP